MAHNWLLKKLSREQENDVFIKIKPPAKVTKEDWIAQLQHIHIQDGQLIEELQGMLLEAKATETALRKEFNAYKNTEATAMQLEDAKNEIESLKRSLKGVHATVSNYAEELDGLINQA